ncbi:hypothetical protein M514_04606 [Trichuris suis]|uniref:Ufm1-specific protease n=1 Tax=Trichuris suis TaxID=68888 RepID=A0A085MB63_9BILA|nr:hypothetical protein M513_04606 [Trichuris suis]KFD73323.1 hypothetical protein M514_04606 [Trichuris suis]
MQLNVSTNFLGSDHFLYDKGEQAASGILVGVGVAKAVFVFRGLVLQNDLSIDNEDSFEEILQICDTLPGGISVVGFFSIASSQHREHFCYDSFRAIGRRLQETELSNVFVPSANGYVFCWTSPMDLKSAKFQFVHLDSFEGIEDSPEPLLAWIEVEELTQAFCTIRSTVFSSFDICIPKDHIPADARKEIIISYKRLKEEFYPSRVFFLSKAMDVLTSHDLTEGPYSTGSSTASELHRRLCSLSGDKKCLQGSSQFYQPVDVQCFFDTSIPFDGGSGIIGVELSIDNFIHFRLPCTLNAIAVVPKEGSLLEVHSALCNSLQRCLNAHERAVHQFSDLESLSFPVIEFTLLLPPPYSLYMSVCYPKNRPDEHLEYYRSALHHIWNLPMDRCFFRRACKFELAKEGQLIRSIHKLVAPPSTTGRTAVVQGPYNYHHYMQDSFDDRGWGCAYRSLQTIWSWYVLNGYTNVPVPTHREIQEALVQVGDKQSSFIGAKKWIGSLELNYVLSHVLKIDSKILNARNGSEIDLNADELLCHFKGEGTPVMIGGGVLAHVILGVFIDEASSVVKYLVLDPHYTGPEDVKSIVQKGWCGWKPSTFWAKSPFYNLLLPSRPRIF